MPLTLRHELALLQHTTHCMQNAIHAEQDTMQRGQRAAVRRYHSPSVLGSRNLGLLFAIQCGHSVGRLTEMVVVGRLQQPGDSLSRYREELRAAAHRCPAHAFSWATYHLGSHVLQLEKRTKRDSAAPPSSKGTCSPGNQLPAYCLAHLALRVERPKRLRTLLYGLQLSAVFDARATARCFSKAPRI